MCKRYPGFIRVALQDPHPERKFYRRGWVTFDRTVNIKEICWNLNNIRVCGLYLFEYENPTLGGSGILVVPPCSDVTLRDLVKVVVQWPFPVTVIVAGVE